MEYLKRINNNFITILLSQLFKIPCISKAALFLYEYRKKTKVRLFKHSHFLINFTDNPFNTFQELREFTGKICAIKNGLPLINRLYAQQDTIPPFFVCFKLYEEGKALKNYFISKQHKGLPLSEKDERLLFTFLSDCPNYTLSNMLSWVHPDEGFKIRKERILKSIKGVKGRLLEIGCSTAPWFEDFIHNEEISLYIGSDISHFALRIGKISKDTSKSEFLQCHAEKLPFKNGSFEIAIASEIMEHLENPEDLCNETFRILKEDGIFIVSVPMHVVDQHNITDALDFGDFTHNPSFPNLQQLKDLFLATHFIIEDVIIDPYYIFKLRKSAGVNY